MQLRLLKSRVLQSSSQPRRFRSRTIPSSRKNSRGARVSSILLLEDALSPAPLHPQTAPPPAPVDTTTNVVEPPVSTTPAIPSPVFKTSNFVKTEYRAQFRGTSDRSQAARFIDPYRVEKLRIMVREGRWVNDFGSVSVVEKNSLSDRLSVPRPAVDGKLEVSLYLADGFHRCAVSRTIDDFEID